MPSKKSEQFQSPTWGTLDFEGMIGRIKKYAKEKPEASYQVVVGTDSAPHKKNESDFVTAIVVLRVGKGGIYFWCKSNQVKVHSLYDRILKEATLSLDFAHKLLSGFQKAGILEYDFEIHVDIGKIGETREMISEVVGMIRGSGFKVKTKPEAFGASTVADRHA